MVCLLMEEVSKIDVLIDTEDVAKQLAQAK